MVKIIFSKLSEILDEALKLKWIVFGIILFLFGWNEREYLVNGARINHNEINFWDILITTTSDVYLIIYLIFPFLIYIMINLIVKECDFTVLIRFGSYRKWIGSLQKKFSLYIGITIFIWLLVSLILSIGLPFTNDWSSGSENILKEPLILQKYFSHPSISFVLQLISFLLTIYLIHTFLCILYVILKSKVAIATIGISLFLFAIFSFKLFSSFFKGLALSNYLLYYHGVLYFGSKMESILIVFIACISMYLLYFKIDKLYLLKKFPLEKLWLVLYLFLYLLGVTIFANQLKKQNVNAIDAFLEIFQGTSSQGYLYIYYLFYILVYMGFVFIIQYYLDKEVSGLSYYRIIRYRSLYKWFGFWINRICLTSITFLIFIFSSSLIIFFLLGINFHIKSEHLPDINVYLIFYHFFINGFLQLLFYILILWIIRWYTSESTHNLLMFAGLIILLIPGLEYFPIGLNGFGHLSVGKNPSFFSLILLMYIGIQCLVILFLLKKQDINN